MDSEPQNFPGTRMQIVTFQLAGARYGLPLHDVREMHRAVAVTSLPSGPGMVEGVIDVRGELVPVMALRRRLGHSERAVDVTEHLIVASARGRAVAIRVDRIDGVVELDQRAIQPAPGLAADAQYISGIARLPDGLVVIHDLHRFFTPAEDASLSNALHALQLSRRAD